MTGVLCSERTCSLHRRETREKRGEKKELEKSREKKLASLSLSLRERTEWRKRD